MRRRSDSLLEMAIAYDCKNDSDRWRWSQCNKIMRIGVQPGGHYETHFTGLLISSKTFNDENPISYFQNCVHKVLKIF